MSEASTDRADRPAEVTDPLLWDLAAAVADAHQPDESQTCVSASCVGAHWPCAAWNNAQDGLRAALAPQPESARPATAQSTPLQPATPRPAPAQPAMTRADGDGDERHDDPLTGWSTDLAPAAPALPADRELAATSAA
jgi:hypothetical protein